MKTLRWALTGWLAVVAVPLALAAKEPAISYNGKPGPYGVETASYDWQDAARQRNVPVKLYFPKTGTGPFPVIIFSHGLGGSRWLRVSGPPLGQLRLRLGPPPAPGKRHGRVEGPGQTPGGHAAIDMDLRNSINRPLDVRFAIDQMEKLNRDQGPLHGRLDLRHVGMAGHSFGAWTTLAVIGEAFAGPGGRETSLTDPRIKAAIAMSPSVPRDKTRLDQAFGKIKVPCLHMTGTLDDSPIGETKAKERRLPFDHITGADQYLVVFIGGDHMIFSGRGRLSGDGKIPPFKT